MFVRRLTEAEEKAIYDTAAETAVMFNELGFPWWLSHNSMYSSWIFHGVQPWEDDLDIAVPRERIADIEAYVTSRGWGFRRMHSFAAKIWNPERAMHRNRYGWTWPFVDLALYDEVVTRNSILIEHDYCKQFSLLHKDDVMPTRFNHFGDLMLPLPANPEAYLDIVFPKWRTEVMSAFYCHRTERAYSEPVQYLSPKELSKEYKLYNVSLD